MRRVAIGLCCLLGGLATATLPPAPAIATDTPLDLPEGAAPVSVDRSGRFVVLTAQTGLYRVDRLLGSITKLPAMLAVSDDGWYGITTDKKWTDFVRNVSTPVPDAAGYVLSGDGQTYVANLAPGQGSLLVAAATGAVETFSIRQFTAVVLSSNGNHAIAQDPLGRRFLWSRDDPGHFSGNMWPETSILPVIADDGRVVVRNGDRVGVLDVDGRFHVLREHVDASTPIGIYVSGLSANGRVLTYVQTPTSCCRSVYAVDVDTGVRAAVASGSVNTGGTHFQISGDGATIAQTVFTGFPQKWVLISRPVPFARPTARLRPGEVHAVQVSGRGDVPADATAAMLTVTAVNPISDGYVTVFPCGTTAPLASSANFVAGQTVANGALSALGPDGTVCVTSNVGIDVIVDVQGWFGAGSPYHPIVPTRARDTRDTVGGMVRVGQVTSIGVNGVAGFEPDATAVVVNVTVTNPDSEGHLRIWACESPPPEASSVNFAAGQTVANLVVSAVGPKGAICAKSSATVDLVVDVVGSFTAGSPYHAITPLRIADTRHGESDPQGNVPMNDALEVPVAGKAGEGNETGIAADATAIVVNLTITNPSQAGYATVYACGQPAPLASNINFVAGATVAGAAISAIGTGGMICVTSSADVDVIVDVQGWFGADSPYHAMTPARLDDTRG